MKIKPIGPEQAQFITDSQKVNYPPEMFEPVEVWLDLLSKGFSWGAFVSSAELPEPVLVGWLIAHPETISCFDHSLRKAVYIDDVVVFPDWRHMGVMKALTIHAYREFRWRGLWVRMHCRRASYPSPGFLWRQGYEIVEDNFIKNHYGVEYETDTLVEDARELKLCPIRQVR